VRDSFVTWCDTCSRLSRALLAQVETGPRPGLITDERDRLKELEHENHDLRVCGESVVGVDQKVFDGLVVEVAVKLLA
jgi:hypothetical protein